MTGIGNNRNGGSYKTTAFNCNKCSVQILADERLVLVGTN
jgi:hypothetical protein